jgi:hypothetical protein
MSTSLGLYRRVSLAVALALGTLPQAFANTGRKVRELSFALPKAKATPFSSTRQHRRTARTQINRVMPNGQVVMQTLPSYLRRNDVEVDAILAGDAKIGVIGLVGDRVR